MIEITADMREIISRAILCFVATVSTRTEHPISRRRHRWTVRAMRFLVRQYCVAYNRQQSKAESKRWNSMSSMSSPGEVTGLQETLTYMPRQNRNSGKSQPGSKGNQWRDLASRFRRSFALYRRVQEVRSPPMRLDTPRKPSSFTAIDRNTGWPAADPMRA